MTLFRRRLPWREPPIVIQIIGLLLGGLVVAQLVTLLLTLVLPPAPAAQHGFGEIAAALTEHRTNNTLAWSEQWGPPDMRGPGWFTSAESRHELATMVGARDNDVRLAFYAPLPFAGITVEPPAPGVSIEQLSWQIWPEPLRPSGAKPARLIPASLIVDGPEMAAGGPAGGGYGLAGAPPGAGFGDRGSFGNGFRRGGGQRGGQSDGRGGGGTRVRGARPDGAASPADLDHQPTGPYARYDDEDAGPVAPDEHPNAANVPIATPGNGSDVAPTPSPVAPALPPTARKHDTQSSAPAIPATVATAAAVLPAARQSANRTPPNRVVAPSRPMRTAQPPGALFGLAPAPFVEGDFIAALRQPDGRWAVVQPKTEGFPNTWQRRVILWFAIAFALVAPIGWLFARHIVRPLARFTTAAEQLGRDPSAALVTLEGPAEIGRAARAFNVMQNRLRSFVEDRTAMVGAISHDLRTPLTRLRFRIEEVEDDDIRDGMNEEVAEMEAMISSVLAFIRDASTVNVRERLDLGILMEDVAQDATLIGSDVTIERLASAPVEVDVLGIRRLLANLVENAVKYGHRARIRLWVDDYAAVAKIIDDGPGVPEDELERAFEPFYRASNAAASGKSGTGLGLAVCRSIARAHGGDVRLLRSAEGFSAELRLPLAYDSGRIAA
jgi:two-component system OmpR family sensor kinase